MTGKKEFEQPNVDSNTVAELSKKLLEVNKKLQEAENERKQMLENISHDLRAPLTAIRSTVDYLNDKSKSGTLDISSAETTDLFNLLDSRTRTLEVMVNDLYYLTCIESGRDGIKPVKVPLGQFLEEYFFAIQMDDKYSKKDLALEVSEDSDVMVEIDPDKMSRVLDNLFTNARKYSDDGAQIALGLKEEESTAIIYVRDTGFGMPEDAIPHIFDRTYRITGARTPTKETSSGLGLSIVKSVVEQHGGRIWCESELGKGSCFYVELPIVE